MLAENIHKRRRVVLALSCVVVFVTTYMLILPAFTLEKTKAAEQGGIDVPGVTTTAEDVSEEDADANDGQTDAQDVQTESGKTEDGKVEDSGSQSKDSDEANADASAEDPLTFEDEHYTIAVDDKNSVLPENTEIKVEEIDKAKDEKEYQKHFDDALAAIQEEKDGENVSDLEFARFYDISLVSDGKEVTLGNGDKVSVNIEYDKELRKALGVENKDNIRIIHFAENKDTGKVEAEVLDNKEAKVTAETTEDNLLKEAAFDAESFSVYGLVYVKEAEEEAAQAEEKVADETAEKEEAKEETKEEVTEETTEVKEKGSSSIDLGTAVVSTVDGSVLPETTDGHADVVKGRKAIKSVENTIEDLNTENVEYKVFDIALDNINENEYKDGFKVDVTLPENVRGSDFRLFHIHDGKVEELPLSVDGAATSTKGVENVSGFTFETENFSQFVLSYTVDFGYSVNGVDYGYTLQGGDSVALSEIIEALHIVEDTNFKDTKELLEAVENVTFSDESLVKVTHKTPILGVIGKEDWILKSLKPFDTNETLTITLKDGQQITIKVTDAQYSNLADFITDASLEIDGKTYGEGTTWNVRKDVDYSLKLAFKEAGSRQFPKGGDEMIMDMPAGLTLEPGASGSFDIPCGLAGTVTGNTWWVDNSGKLHVKFGNDPDNLLTRSSNVHFELEFNAKFDGSQTEFDFNNNVKRTAEFDTSTDLDVNKTSSYNPETGKMEYTVTVKATGNPTDVKITDAISGDMLTLDENSITITPSSKIPSSKHTNSKGFDMIFASMSHNETVVIKYTASVDTTKIGAKGTVEPIDGTNKVTVEDDQGDKDEKENVVHEIKYSNITKTSTSTTIKKDDETAEVEWKIVANDNFMGSLVGSKITDKIDWNSKDIMSYPSPLQLSVVVKDRNGNQVGQTLTPTVIPTTDGNGIGSWEYTIPQIDNKDEVYSYEITYKTIVERQADNVTVKNNAENEKDGTSSGVGVVEGTNPGGGGGTDDVTGGKAAVKVTPEYIDWDIVVAIKDTDDFTGKFEIVDEIPNGANLGRKFADTFDSIISVDGLKSNEDYSYEVTKESHDNLTPKQKDILKITFYQDKAHNDPGLDKGARTITVRIRTKNDPDWVNFADTAGGGEQAIYHTNSAKVNDSKPFTDRAAPMHTKIDKEKETDLAAETVGDVQLPRYEYSVVLTNVTELPIVITDTYDPNELVFVGEGQATGWTGHHGIAAASQKNNLNNPDNNYHATFSADDEAGVLTITANDLPKKPDGSFYEFYKIYYTMRIKDAEALNSIRQQALANGGKYLVGNTAEWNDVDDHVDIEFKVPALDKTGYFAKDKGESPNNRLYTYLIDVNRDRLTMNNGKAMELTDTHTDNLSVDYSSIKVYKITDGQSKEDATQYNLTDDMLTTNNEVTWNFDANEGTFTIPDSTHYVIKYNALVIGSGNQEISNIAEMKGYSSTKTDSKDFGHDSSAGADVLEINLLKYENGQTSNGLQGATFQLFKGTGEYDPVTGEEIKEEMKYGDTPYTRGKQTASDYDRNGENVVGQNITFTTGPKGTVVIRLNQTYHGAQLDYDTHYYLKEIESPPGYQIDSSVEYWAFTLTANPDEVNYGDPDRRDEYGNRQWIYFYYGDILKMANTPTVQPLDVVVDKSWYDKDGNEITGENLDDTYVATVRLLRKTDNGAYKPVKVESSGGNIVVTDLEDSDAEQANVYLNKGNNWEYKWEDLPRVEMGGDKGLEIVHRYAYKIQEVSVDGYITSMSETEDELTKTYALKNYKVPDDRDTDIKVKKEWQDSDGQTIEAVEKLPDNIQFYLYRVVSTTPFERVPSTGGEKYIVDGDSHLLSDEDTNPNYGKYQISKADNWQHTFNNLPEVKNIGGNTYYYAYYVKELPVKGYTTTYTNDGTTRTIVNKEPLPEGKYINIGLEKKWTDGENETPPDGASATFTLHQQKSTKSGGSSGNLSVVLVYDNNGEEKVLDSRFANIGDTVEFSCKTSEQAGTNVDVYRYIKHETYAEDGYQYAANINGNGDLHFSYTLKEGDGKNGTVKFKIKEASFVDKCVELPSWDSGAPTFSDYENTKVTQTINLPYGSSWSYNFKNLVQEDADGNLYRYYITEDSCSPTATNVTFKDSDGNDIEDPNAEGNQSTTINTDKQKVIVENTYSPSLDVIKLWKDSSSQYTDWQKNITIVLHKEPVSGGSTSTYTYTAAWDSENNKLKISSNDNKAPNATIAKDTTSAGYRISFPTLEGGYKYYVTEEAVDGCKAPSYGHAVSSTTTGDPRIEENTGADADKASNGQYITNAPEDAVELPHTGGIGTVIFYVLGSILVIGGGIYFISRRRAMK